MGRLKGKVAIITGGNSGIGYATAKLFCDEGAKVIISARREADNQRVVEELSGLGGEISAVQGDVSKQDNCKQIIDRAIDLHGRVDILVNNAGIVDKHRSIKNCSEEWYDEVCKIDQYSVFYMCKYVLPHMEKEGKGSIVNISSIGGWGVGGVSYSAAKAAVNSMSKNIALMYAATDIRCNVVAPGPTPTPLNTPDKLKEFDMEFAQKCGRHIDLSLPAAEVEDQAEAILFFASDAAKAVTGQILYVDHGTSLF